MHEQRVLLRTLLHALLAERADSEGLYIPHGEAGMCRMIRALLAVRPTPPGEDPLRVQIDAFHAQHRLTGRESV